MARRAKHELLDRLQRGGEAFVSNAVINGCFWLRACVVNIRTQAADIGALVALTERIGTEITARGELTRGDQTRRGGYSDLTAFGLFLDRFPYPDWRWLQARGSTRERVGSNVQAYGSIAKPAGSMA